MIIKKMISFESNTDEEIEKPDSKPEIQADLTYEVPDSIGEIVTVKKMRNDL